MATFGVLEREVSDELMFAMDEDFSYDDGTAADPAGAGMEQERLVRESSIDREGDLDHTFPNPVKQTSDLDALDEMSESADALSKSVPVIPIYVPEDRHLETQMNQGHKDHKKVHIGDFELLSVIGRGAYGKVFQVKHITSGKIFAMKVLRKDSIKKSKDLHHTKAERQVLEAAKCSFIVNLRFAFQSAKKLYLILDYVPGGELFTRLDEKKEFTEEEARFYAAEVVIAIEHLHSMHIIYRDLKPENILLNSDGHICLTDFGFAKFQVKEPTQTRTFCGTVQYMAPEIVQKSGHGKPADWWALGVLLFEMVTGVTPFHASNRKKVQHNIMSKKIKYPTWLSHECQHLLKGLLQRTVKKRLGTNGVDDIKNHRFFVGVKWDQVLNKNTTPPYVPDCSELDTSCFDDKFTSEPLIDSPAHSPDGKVSDSEMTNYFKGFSYVRTPSPHKSPMKAHFHSPQRPLRDRARSGSHDSLERTPVLLQMPPPVLGSRQSDDNDVPEAALSLAIQSAKMNSSPRPNAIVPSLLAKLAPHAPVKANNASDHSSDIAPQNSVTKLPKTKPAVNPSKTDKKPLNPSAKPFVFNPTAKPFVPSWGPQ